MVYFGRGRSCSSPYSVQIPTTMAITELAFGSSDEECLVAGRNEEERPSRVYGEALAHPAGDPFHIRFSDQVVRVFAIETQGQETWKGSNGWPVEHGQ